MVDRTGKTGFDRRGFLRRTAMVVGGFVVGVMGAEPAMATVRVGCCDLCHHPASCQWTGCKAVLNWVCTRPGSLEGDEVWGCYECYSEPAFHGVPGFYCRGLSCNSALCSVAYCWSGCGPPSPC